MERRYPIAWDCATDEIREVTYNGMAKDLSDMWDEIERLTAENETMRVGIRKAGVMLEQGYGRTSVCAHLVDMLQGRYKP